MKPDKERVRLLLTDTVLLLCKNGLNFSKEMKVQGLLGITVDSEVFLVHIDETMGCSDTVTEIMANNLITAETLTQSTQEQPQGGVVEKNGSLYGRSTKSARRQIKAAKRASHKFGRKLSRDTSAYHPRRSEQLPDHSIALAPNQSSDFNIKEDFSAFNLSKALSTDICYENPVRVKTETGSDDVVVGNRELSGEKSDKQKPNSPNELSILPQEMCSSSESYSSITGSSANNIDNANNKNDNGDIYMSGFLQNFQVEENDNNSLSLHQPAWDADTFELSLSATMPCSSSSANKTKIPRISRLQAMVPEHQLACPFPECERLFSQASSLKRHMTVFHQAEQPEPPTAKAQVAAGDNPANQLACPYPECESQFSRASSLKRHIDVIHEHLRYTCSICNKVFRYQHILANHMKVHND